MRVNDAFIGTRRKGGRPLRPRRAMGRRGPSALRGELTEVVRRTILDGAEEVFGSSGFADARMSEIAEKAGLAAGTLYNYFDSKEAIFGDLVAARGEELAARLGAIVDARGDAGLRLLQLVRTTFTYVESHGAMLGLLLQVGAPSTEGSAVPCRRQSLRTLELYRAVLTQAARRGVIRRGFDTRELAAVLAGAMGGMVRGWLLSRRRGRLADRAEFLVDVFLAGAGARP